MLTYKMNAETWKSALASVSRSVAPLSILHARHGVVAQLCTDGMLAKGGHRARRKTAAKTSVVKQVAGMAELAFGAFFAPRYCSRNFLSAAFVPIVSWDGDKLSGPGQSFFFPCPGCHL